MDLDMTLRSYLRERLYVSFSDTYRGVPMMKFPEDLRTYENFLWEMRADAVIEVGVYKGGSALWFRDRLADLARATHPEGVPAHRPKVIAVDISPNPGLPEDVIYIQSDICDPALPERIAEALAPSVRPFIIEDSAHVYETTLATLNALSRFVPEDGYFVIEDGVVDIEDLRLDESWPRGVQRALTEWLPANPRFHQVAPPYLVTLAVGGLLRASRSEHVGSPSTMGHADAAPRSTGRSGGSSHDLQSDVRSDP